MAKYKARGSVPAVHKQHFLASSLRTSSVTIYPDNRAAVVREVPGVVIKPGRNEITITNLAAAALVETIKVSGRVGGVVTDVEVEQVARVPDTDADSDSDSSSVSDSGDDSDFDSPRAAARRDVAAATATVEAAEAAKATNDQQRTLLERCTFPGSHATATPAGGKHVPELLQMYGQQRTILYEQGVQLGRELNAARRALARAQKRASRLRSPGEAELKAERARDRANRASTVLRVRITIESDVPVHDTAGSVEARVHTGQPQRADEPMSVDDAAADQMMLLSYIATGASWEPKYDLQLDTLAGEGSLTYRASFKNCTGETWRDVAITLSTSQNTFKGVGDKVPIMESWMVSLRRKPEGDQQANGEGSRDGEQTLYSAEELALRQRERAARIANLSKRAAYNHPMPAQCAQMPPLQGGPQMRQMSQQQMLHHQQQLQQQMMQQQQQMQSQTSAPQQQYQMQLMLLEQQNKKRLAMARQETRDRDQDVTKKKKRTAASGDDGFDFDNFSADGNDSGDVDDDSDSSAGTLAHPHKRLRLATSTSSTTSYGTTTTYALAGTRTIPSSTVARRHVITELTLPDIIFSHISVPKLRTAAFLNARIRNPSAGATALLRGAAGVTLDGSFLGTAAIPRCAPGDIFDLGLGADEAVQVRYAKPVLRDAGPSSSIFRADRTHTFVRHIVVRCQARRPVTLTVRDQVPVSEDTRLRIEIAKPRGLRAEGDVVDVDEEGNSLGAPGAATTTTNAVLKKVGIAALKKRGDVEWRLEIAPGQIVDLPLEYAARMPGGEIEMRQTHVV